VTLFLKPSKISNLESLHKEGCEVQQMRQMGTSNGSLFWNPSNHHNLLIDLGWLNICYQIMFWNGAWHNRMWSLIWWRPCFGMTSRPSWMKGSPHIIKSWKLGKSCLICTDEDLRPWCNMFKHLVHYWPCPNEGGIFVQNGVFPWLATLGLRIHPSKKWSPKLLSRDDERGKMHGGWFHVP